MENSEYMICYPNYDNVKMDDSDNYFLVKDHNDNILFLYVKKYDGYKIPDNFTSSNTIIQYKDIPDEVKGHKHSFHVGDKVHVKDYGKMVFYIKSIKGDKVTVCSNIRYKEYIVKANINDVKECINEDIFIYNEVQILPTNKIMAVDGDYWADNLKNSFNVITFLIRVKMKYDNHELVWFGKTNKYVKAVFKLFNMTIVNRPITADVYVSNHPVFETNTSYKLLSMNDNFFKETIITKLDVIKYAILKCSNSLDINTVKIQRSTIDMLNIYSAQKVINIIGKDKIIKAIKGVSKVNINKLKKPINHNEVIQKMGKHNWKWFLENYDYYISIIRG